MYDGDLKSDRMAFFILSDFCSWELSFLRCLIWLWRFQGGITNGNDVVFRVAFKPIPSLAQPQQTVNRAGEPCEIALEGRHDVCALPRALVLVEALAAMVTLDMGMMNR